MTRTFLVAIEVGTEYDIASMTQALDEDIADAGWEVVSVKPWDAPVLDAGAILPPSISAAEPPPTLGG